MKHKNYRYKRASHNSETSRDMFSTSLSALLKSLSDEPVYSSEPAVPCHMRTHRYYGPILETLRFKDEALAAVEIRVHHNAAHVKVETVSGNSYDYETQVESLKSLFETALVSGLQHLNGNEYEGLYYPSTSQPSDIEHDMTFSQRAVCFLREVYDHAKKDVYKQDQGPDLTMMIESFSYLTWNKLLQFNDALVDFEAKIQSEISSNPDMKFLHDSPDFKVLCEPNSFFRKRFLTQVKPEFHTFGWAATLANRLSPQYDIYPLVYDCLAKTALDTIKTLIETQNAILIHSVACGSGQEIWTLVRMMIANFNANPDLFKGKSIQIIMTDGDQILIEYAKILREQLQRNNRSVFEPKEGLPWLSIQIEEAFDHLKVDRDTITKGAMDLILASGFLNKQVLTEPEALVVLKKIQRELKPGTGRVIVTGLTPCHFSRRDFKAEGFEVHQTSTPRLSLEAEGLPFERLSFYILSNPGEVACKKEK